MQHQQIKDLQNTDRKVTKWPSCTGSASDISTNFETIGFVQAAFLMASKTDAMYIAKFNKCAFLAHLFNLCISL